MLSLFRHEFQLYFENWVHGMMADSSEPNTHASEQIPGFDEKESGKAKNGPVSKMDGSDEGEPQDEDLSHGHTEHKG